MKVECSTVRTQRYLKPNLSRPARCHEIYPYLLRGVSIDRPNQVWSTDITYIPMQGGFLYPKLAAQTGPPGSTFR
jgi:transposase InsO family protein